MHLTAAISGNLRASLQAEVRQVAGAMRRAVTTAGQQAQAELRAQARGAGFKDGGRAIANTWRLRIFPPQGRAPDTLRPAALVYSRMPTVAEGFEFGKMVSPKGGRRLAIPTQYNIRRLRRGKKEPIVSTEKMRELTIARPAMARLGQSNRNRAVLVWYIKVSKTTKRSSFYGKSWLMRKYRVGSERLSSKGVQREWVPMFVLIKPYKMRKRLNIAAVRSRAGAMYARAAVAELSRVGAR